MPKGRGKKTNNPATMRPELAMNIQADYFAVIHRLSSAKTRLLAS